MNNIPQVRFVIALTYAQFWDKAIARGHAPSREAMRYGCKMQDVRYKRIRANENGGDDIW